MRVSSFARLGILLTSALLFSSLSIAGCAAPTTGEDDDLAIGTADDEVRASTLERELKSAVRGMIYKSEGDYPYTPVSARIARGDAITADLVKAKFGNHPSVLAEGENLVLTNMLVKEIQVDAWFDNRGDDPEDPTIDPAEIRQYQKLENLRTLLKNRLTDVHVYRMKERGDSGGVFIFIVGRAPQNKMMGVLTVSIET